MKAKFITFEGIDGAGKSTLVNHLVNIYRGQGEKVFYFSPSDIVKNLTIETDININFQTRDDIIYCSKKVLDILSALRQAPTANNYNKLMINYFKFMKVYSGVIEKYLDEGYFIIADRWYHSSIAYNNIVTGTIINKLYENNNFDLDSIEDTNIKSIKKLLDETLLPDYTFLIDIDIKTAMNRIKEREMKTCILRDRTFEDENKLTRVHNTYLKMLGTSYIKPFSMLHKIESNDSPFELVNKIYKIINNEVV